MDNSKEYVLMCDCLEIQDKHKPKKGDFYIKRGGLGEKWIYPLDFVSWEDAPNCGEGLVGHEERSVNHFNKKEFIWLPRQDQLQDMLGGFKKLFPKGSEELKINHKYCKSFEQLWLAFVMKERYKKIWNGKDWVKK